MNRIRAFLGGDDAGTGNGSSSGGGGGRGGGYPNDRNSNNTNQQSSWSTRTWRYNHSDSKGNDDLYLSDDDDWGMSAYKDSSYKDHHDEEDYEYGGGARRSSSAFWDQGQSLGAGGAGLDGGATAMEMSTPNKKKSGSNRGLQEWEREAMMRDNIDGNFEIGDDDIYHSDRRNEADADVENNNNAYDDVQDDISNIEDESTASSNKEEVVNAYRDYLMSIRDGGFESYLDKDGNEVTAAPGAEGGVQLDESDNYNDNGDERGEKTDAGEDDALERVLDIEEERASGSMYGDLYGVQDMRSSSASPYSAWRAKAKLLLQQEEEREKTKSPSRAVLDRLRRKRNSTENDSNHNNGNNSINSRVSQNEQFDRWSDRPTESEKYAMSERMYSYRPAIFQNPRCRSGCIAFCLVVALAGGLSYYGEQHKAKVEAKEDELDERYKLAIPPKETTSSAPVDNANNFSQNNPYAQPQQQGQSGVQHSGPSDAVVNALKAFDPIWYDRLGGWEGITWQDSLNFCLTHEKRVPCSYEIYCNDGEDPYRGDRPNGEQWAAISNGSNQWVQVGGMFTCKRYTDLHNGKKPEWGMSGISMEHEHGAGGITQNIMCCIDVHQIGLTDPSKWGVHDKIEHVEADTTEKTTNNAIVNVKDTDNEKSTSGQGSVAVAKAQDTDALKREKAVIAAFQPIWFSSAHGWTGTSYEDAIIFCESYNHMVLCPYAAYCPGGQNRPALPGSMVTDLDGEEWVPANGPMNTWVQVGRIDGDESTRCTLHHDILGERPQWGIDGTRTDVKHHIMCCLM